MYVFSIQPGPEAAPPHHSAADAAVNGRGDARSGGAVQTTQAPQPSGHASTASVRNYGSLDTNMAASSSSNVNLEARGGVELESSDRPGGGAEVQSTARDTQDPSTLDKPPSAHMKTLPDIVKSCDDIQTLSDHTTQTDSVMPPVAVAVADPTRPGGLQQVGAVNPNRPPGLNLVELTQDELGDYVPCMEVPDLTGLTGPSNGNLAERMPGDGLESDLGEGSRTLAYKEGRTPTDAKAANLLSSKEHGQQNMGFDAIHLEVVNGDAGLRDTGVQTPQSDCDKEISPSPERDSESLERDGDSMDGVPTKQSWLDTTVTQRFILAALMLGNIFSAVFYSLLAPFFPAEVSPIYL